MTAITPSLAEAQRAVDDVLGEGFRVEVVGRAIVATPGAGWSHNELVGDLLVWLRPRVPAPLTVVGEVDVGVEASGTTREPYWRPDLVVSAGPADLQREWLLAAEVALAVEVVSPGNRDRTSGERYLEARAEHGAEHGIEWLLGIDGDDVQWWQNGRRVVSGPPWAAGLSIRGGRVVAERR
jgi:Uma2 family endonuclease